MLPRPRVSPDKRHLAFPNGDPFFWLGDTAWELFHRLTREDVELYLTTRTRQGFNVIQIVGLAEFDGIREPNRYGHLPLIEEDPARLNEPYWQNVDHVVSRAAELGLYIALVPTWGDKVTPAWGIGPVIFDDTKAHAYGLALGRRYADRDNVIWINGGDRSPKGKESVWRALAAGLREGDGGHERLMTFHPQGGQTSAQDFHEEGWLDLNMMQTGHGRPDLEYVARLTRSCYDRTPIKPVIDGEPCYENHPIDFGKQNGYFDELRVRQAMYTSIFAGGCGITYGCHAVWQFACDRYEPINNPISHWRYSLTLPGANQVRHLKDLMLSLPFFEMAPAELGGSHRSMATPDHSTIVVHTVDDSAIVLANAVKPSQAEWFNPVDGGRVWADLTDVFEPPTREGHTKDWVLIVRNG